MPSTRQLLTSSSQSHDVICCDITPGERSSGPSSSYESLFSLANVCHPNISLTLLMARNKKPFKSHHEIKGCIIKMHTGKKKNAHSERGSHHNNYFFLRDLPFSLALCDVSDSLYILFPSLHDQAAFPLRSAKSIMWLWLATASSSFLTHALISFSASLIARNFFPCF